MNEMSIIIEIAETVNQYEEELLFDVESHHHEYILKYDEANQNMFLKVKESYRTDRGWSHNYTTIELYNITPSMYANICIIILRDHIQNIKNNGRGVTNTKHILKVQPQLITPL